MASFSITKGAHAVRNSAVPHRPKPRSPRRVCRFVDEGGYRQRNSGGERVGNGASAERRTSGSTGSTKRAAAGRGAIMTSGSAGAACAGDLCQTGMSASLLQLGQRGCPPRRMEAEALGAKRAPTATRLTSIKRRGRGRGAPNPQSAQPRGGALPYEVDRSRRLRRGRQRVRMPQMIGRVWECTASDLRRFRAFGRGPRRGYSKARCTRERSARRKPSQQRRIRGHSTAISHGPSANDVIAWIPHLPRCFMTTGALRLDPQSTR